MTDKQKELAKIAGSYATERDLAFFVVNFGFNKQDYNELTELEKMFIRKEYESKLVNDMTHIRNAVLNAVNNALRKKNKKFIELFKKKNEKVDLEYNLKAVDVITEIEERDGKSWVDKIYQASGLKKPQREAG
ncbi:phenylalanine racemase [Amphibacillus sp. MSJ-3]|nr:phenylalanine racemase [Amphibacillus sp. MSJ-3]